MAGFLNRNPSFAGSAEIQARRLVVPETGARIEVLPADAPGAWGLNPDAVFVDELANWHDGQAARRLWEAVSSAVAKRSDARLVVLTTAGSPDHFSRKVLDHTIGSPLWRVHQIEGPAPWIDPERVEEQRQRLPHSVFEQLWMNRWTVADGAFLDPAVIDAAFCLDGPGLSRQANSYVAALDVGVVHDATAFAIGHRDGEEIHLDRLQTWHGSRRHPVDFEEVEQFIVAGHQMFRFKVSADPWQALDLCQRLRKRGLRVDEFSFGQASKQKLAATLLHSLNVGHLKLYEAEGLRDELMALRLKQAASGAWSFDHTSSGHDDRAVALGLMTVAALQRPSGLPTAVPEVQNPFAMAGRRKGSSLDTAPTTPDWFNHLPTPPGCR
jgi:phage terminase large subunit-like protein